MRAGRWGVSVVVPARDEEASIGACVRSVRAAAAHAGQPVDITVVADRCRDRPAAAALAALEGCGRVVEINVGSVGAGRRIGVAHSLLAIAALGLGPERFWLLATDADSTVPPDWIAAHLGHAAVGAHAVAGMVVVDSFHEHHPSVAPAFRHRYEVGTNGEHPHVHGTNLGVRGDAYAVAGGWRDVATGEDHDLWGRLRGRGARLVPTPAAPVRTSGRAIGRAPAGFASLLCSLGELEESDEIAR